jgi:hypothetical protein
MQDFVALKQGKQVTFNRKQSGRDCAVFRCSHCSMMISARRKITGDWKVQDRDLSHTNCTGSAKLKTAQIANLAHVAASVQAQPSISGPALGRTVRILDAVDPKRWTVYRAKSSLQHVSDAEYEMNFSKLPTYFALLEAINPGTTATVECGPDGRFVRAFVLLGACAHFAKHCIPVSALDSSFLKCSKYNGQLAVLEFIDPSFHDVPVVLCVFAKEDRANYTWLLSKCKAHGLGGVIGKTCSHRHLSYFLGPYFLTSPSYR